VKKKTVSSLKKKAWKEEQMTKQKEPNCKCDNCGKEFWKRPDQIEKTKKNYCCRKCASKGSESKDLWKIVKCAICGKDYQVPRWRIRTTKFCSVECCNKSRKTKKNINNKRTCIVCGKEYYPTNWSQKYCNRACFFKDNKKRKVVKCKECGVEFEQVRQGQMYCSRKCSYKISQKTKKPKNNYLDTLWSKAIKERAGYKCEYCGKEGRVNSHHIFSRSNHSVRWDLDNGICLCVSHHVFGLFSAHKSPLEFADWIRERRGDEWYQKLRMKSKQIKKWSDEDKINRIKYLKDKTKEFEEKIKEIE